MTQLIPITVVTPVFSNIRLNEFDIWDADIIDYVENIVNDGFAPAPCKSNIGYYNNLNVQLILSNSFLPF